MPTPPLTAEQKQQAVDAVARHMGSIPAAAIDLGINPNTFRHRVRTAQDEGFLPNVSPDKPRIRVPARSVYSPMPNSHGKPVRVFVWGCAHDSPTIPDKSRFRHAGLLASELMPDFIVDLGDALDLDSLSTHDAPGSVADRARPHFLAEAASLEEAVAAFHDTAPDPDTVPRYHLDGNHENRAARYEQANPAAQGVYTLPIQQVFARYGWTVRAFREWLFLEGVGFTHAPINGMGREVGGINANQTVAREATFSVVWSHTHKREYVNRPKFGVGNGVQVYNTGSSMPQGYIKPYAGLAMTGWTYGFSELTLRDGQIESARYWSALELAERYAS